MHPRKCPVVSLAEGWCPPRAQPLKKTHDMQQEKPQAKRITYAVYTRLPPGPITARERVCERERVGCAPA